MTNTLADRYEVYTHDRYTDTIRLAHSGNSRDDAVRIANRLDERQDTWFFDVSSYHDRNTPEYRMVQAEMAFARVLERMNTRLNTEIAISPVVVASATLVMDRWMDQLAIDKRELALAVNGGKA